MKETGKELKLTIGKFSDLTAIFKPYQSDLLEHIWEINSEGRVGINSGQAYRYLQTLPDKKSRASVIFFLNDMVDEGVLDYEEKSGKGGYHRVYYPKMDKKKFWEWFAQQVIDTLAMASGGIIPKLTLFSDQDSRARAQRE